jgi:hypothetical protein
MSLFFVDCEGHGPAAGINDHSRFEVGIVEYRSRESFHGVGGTRQTFEGLREFVLRFSEPYIFISDNPAYDWQFVNYYFHLHLGANPFGHSARRIGDLYAGCVLDFATKPQWKAWRRTPHDHHPVHDAMGNAEAFDEICARFGLAVPGSG